ncbi:MAG: hypothetical protein GY751_24205 [Bacteroidetes bacterium]|nr:hypothetical protein [Bacteroidota bacterium]
MRIRGFTNQSDPTGVNSSNWYITSIKVIDNESAYPSGFFLEMRAIKTFITLLVVVFSTSCSNSLLKDLNEFSVPNERIDLVFEGAIESFIALESESGLIDFSKAADPFIYENEYQLDIRLGEGHQLNLVLYSISSENLLGITSQFSAYPLEVIEDKQVYAIVNYTDSNNKVLYSTTTKFAPPHLQPNIFRISNVTEDGFAGRLENVTIYEVHEGLRTSTSTSISSAAIQVTGSFKANNL